MAVVIIDCPQERRRTTCRFSPTLPPVAQRSNIDVKKFCEIQLAMPRISLPASIYILDVRVVTQLRVANGWEANQIVKCLEFDHAVVE